MNTDRLRRAAIILASIATLALVGLLAWPERAPRALVAGSGWSVSGGFTAVTPDTHGVRASIRQSPDAQFLQSWKPGVGNVTGAAVTSPFAVPEAFVVPYRGFAGEPGIALFLECIGDGSRRLVATGRTNTQWSEVLLTRSDVQCDGPVRLVAQSQSTSAYVAVGTPFEVDPIAVAKRSAFVQVALVALAWSVLAGLVLTATRLGIRLCGARIGSHFGIALVGIGSYAQFFVFWWAPAVGTAVMASLVAIGAGAFLMEAWRPRALAPRTPSIASAVWAWGMVAVTLAILVAMVDDGSGPWLVNNRFTPVRWSTDNQIPGIVAEAIASGQHALLGQLAPWSIGDRPPLAYGWHAGWSALSLLAPVLADGHLLAPVDLAAGIAINTLWLVPAALLLQRAFPGRSHALGALLLLCAPFLLFNSVYVWPKLTSAAFGLLAAHLLFLDREAPARLRSDDGGLVLAAILSALALLSHGGALFGVLASLVLTALWRGLPSLRGAVIAPIAAIALLAPWMAWQSAHGMDANPLARQVFAGDARLGSPDASLLELVRGAYAAVSLPQWLSLKADAAMSLLFGLRNSCGLHEAAEAHGLIDRIRVAGFYYPAAGIGPLLLALPLLLTSRGDDARVVSRRLAAFGVLSLALAATISWNCHINHHQSYQSMLALVLACVLAVQAGGAAGKVIAAASIGFVGWIWVIEPLGHFTRIDHAAIALGVLAAFGWWGWIHASRASRGRPS